ncbi:hypothetical protein L0657_23490 [Dyadobacter sp. CY345]|uniref:hypothetical protein n=1 Tax=Dyadobacter sp. CY345 TaxID=2909335 RepID=UPI001F36FA58|nr:hypothetical protein [Dyadobacter sp. CY345]MCF2446938.1 hypothetical protein [Dyadobacter sp. CY345]
MEILIEFKNNEYFFDNTSFEPSKINITLNDETIFLDYEWLIETQFKGGNVGDLFEELKYEMKLGQNSKAPCGGFINFYMLRGCKGNMYIIFSGVNEVSNSHYIVTLHKILTKK